MPSPAAMKKKRNAQALAELTNAAGEIAAGAQPTQSLDALGRDLLELPAAEVAAHLETIKAQLTPESWEAVRKAAAGLFAAYDMAAPSILAEAPAAPE